MDIEDVLTGNFHLNKNFNILNILNFVEIFILLIEQKKKTTLIYALVVGAVELLSAGFNLNA